MKLKNMSTVVALMLVAGFVALTLSLNGGTALVSAAAQNGQIHVTKSCPGDATGAPGGSCVITSSNLAALNGAQVLYDQVPYLTAGPGSSYLLDSNVVVDAGGGDRAVGRCTLDVHTWLGLCAFSDGTGQFAGFEARVDVDCRPSGTPCTWEGTYSFRPLPRR
jgi:hypothetical protein